MSEKEGGEGNSQFTKPVGEAMHVSDVTDEPDRSCDPVEETTSELGDRVEESASPGETRGGAYEQRGWVKWRTQGKGLTPTSPRF